MQCSHRAVLIITRDVEGTSTNVAQKRLDLECGLEEGHEGPHMDLTTGHKWEDNGKLKTHIVLHESE